MTEAYVCASCGQRFATLEEWVIDQNRHADEDDDVSPASMRSMRWLRLLAPQTRVTDQLLPSERTATWT